MTNYHLAKNTPLRCLFFLILISSTLSLTAQTKAEKVRKQILSKDTSSVLVVAHRAHWRYASENSLLAIEHAIAIGVDIIEIDIQRTKDGHLILMHDETLDRTTTGGGRVDSLDLDSIKNLRLRNGIGVATNEHVPTLEEVLKLTNNRVMLNLDKADRYIDDTYKLLRKTKTADMVIMKTGHSFADARVQFHEHLFESILMPIINLNLSYAESELDAYLGFMKPKLVELTFEDKDNPLPQIIKQKVEHKTLLWYNSMWGQLSGGLDDDTALENPNQVYGYLIDSLGANIIQTDRPDMLLNYLRERGLHD